MFIYYVVFTICKFVLKSNYQHILCRHMVWYEFRGGDRMATSSFGKQFTVQQEKATDFVEEMVKAVAPTLRGAFQSRFANLSQDKDLKTAIGKALSKNE